MKVMKWVCRYAFLGLILILCLSWCIYCAVAVNQLKNTVNSLEFIDMATQLSPEAPELLDRIPLLEEQFHTGIIATVIAAACLVCLIIFHVVSTMIRKKKSVQRSQPRPVVKTAPPAPAAPEKKGGYCTNCGAYYESIPAFCTKCGQKMG